ncbi:MAG: TonB-dependent receptor domain-containing protein, partial [Gammaproteobacteria bacterium]
EKQPEDALAWARLAELHLMLGDKQEATDAAQKAAELAPNLGRIQITLGFTALAEFRASDAQAAFEKAITLDSADPLPHLGLGLARISMGELAQGRSEIEVAVGLGSNDALLRAYLGKAYFEEKRAPLDSQQFTIASQLDPMDPTPWLYEGIAKQTQNQPVEAAAALGKSIELNDNRASYRGRLLLDKDRAARGTSLARAYNDLGFEGLGVNESTKSLTVDPSNASAHRFLSDTYQGVRRREISRVSELFQAQMMQDVNINPVQPSISSTNLNIVTLGGPSSAGFNEFTPLFERNTTRFDVTGVSGENDTRGGEAVATVVHDQFSLSLGAFDFDTDGYRSNNNISHEIGNLYGQVALTPKLSLQAELRARDTEHGDLALNFDPDDFSSEFERDFEEDTAHIGLKYAPSTASTILLSIISSERDEKQGDSSVESAPAPFPPFPPGSFIVTTTSFDGDTEEDSSQVEAQYIYSAEQFNLIAGVGVAEVDQEFNTLDSVIVVFPPPIPSPPPVLTARTETPTIDDMRGYFYSNLQQNDTVTWTLGMSYQEYEEDAFDFDRVNSKFGVQWDARDNLRLRAAYFEVVKPALASNRTLEPTQVAGFNQFFDDANGTKSKRYGGALDWQPSRNLWVGVEVTKRDFKSPEFDPISPTESVAVFDEREEWLDRIYAYWTPAKHWGVSVEAVHDKYESDSSLDFNHPSEITTLSLPFQVQYFHPSGLFAGLGVTYVDQDVERDSAALLPPESRLEEGDSNFTVVDLALGYRLPKRRGIISVSVQNLADEDFDYQDDSFREFKDEPATGPYIPERVVMGRVTLNF